MMKKLLAVFILIVAVLILAVSLRHRVSANAMAPNLPVYTADGKLALPGNYRDWTFLTSGLGMNYSNGTNSDPMFTNVYVTPEALQGFKATGKWPDKSMFVVELYSSVSHGSINKSGHYQDAFNGLDIEVKDSSRPEEWSYYNFNPGDSAGEAIGPGCKNCHNKNGAVEHTFVQFYPTLLDFAVEKNVIKPGVSIPLNESRFLKLMETTSWDKVEQAYADDRRKNPDSDLLNERALNRIGYSFLRRVGPRTSVGGESARAGELAISVFELVTKNYPNSANAYDSLADGYVAASRPQLAIAASQKELALIQSDSSLRPEQKKQLTDLAQKRIAELTRK